MNRTNSTKDIDNETFLYIKTNNEELIMPKKIERISEMVLTKE